MNTRLIKILHPLAPEAGAQCTISGFSYFQFRGFLQTVVNFHVTFSEFKGILTMTNLANIAELYVYESN